MVSSVNDFISVRGRFGRSRASKVTDIGANRKRICDFLLVRNSRPNLGPILHSFGDQTGFMCFWPHPYSTPILGTVFPLHQIAHVGRQRAHDLKLFGREIIFEEFQPIWSRYLNVTETDGRHAISYPRSALASRDKNVNALLLRSANIIMGRSVRILKLDHVTETRRV